MSDHLPPPEDRQRRAAPAHRARRPVSFRAQMRWLSLAPAPAAAGAVAGSVALAGGPWMAPSLTAFAAGSAAGFLAHRYGSQIAEMVTAERAQAEQLRRRAEQHERWMTEWIVPAIGRVRRGLAEHLPGGAAPDPKPEGNAYKDAHRGLEHLCWEQRAVLERPNTDGQQVEMLLHIARRLQTLVNLSFEQLDEIEAQIEDPELLADVLKLDHVVTRLRRAVESLAVIGGETARVTPDSVPLATVLAQAGAEILDYTRVRVANVPTVAVHGYASSLVTHLVAELLENATKWSPADQPVTVRTVVVPSGTLSVEIDDFGLLLRQEKLAELNRLLSRPDEVNIDAQLRQGQIGLYVTALIAQKYGLRVQLRPSPQDGNQAVVVFPPRLLEPMDSAEGPASVPLPTQRRPEPASAGPRSVPPPEPVPATTVPLSRHRSEPAPRPAAEPGGQPPRLPRRDGSRTEVPPHRPAARTGSAPGPADTAVMERFSNAVRHAEANGEQSPGDWLPATASETTE
jgi:signal transduction histidine kinase